jgi:hypothetical protein
MGKNDKLYKLLDKKSISISELRRLYENELVQSVESKKSDRKFFNKYDVRLDNGELYYVYVRKSISELLEEGL